jgi:membrane-associated phospholipid phosphatase
MRISEWIAVAYFGYLAILSWTGRAPARRAARLATSGAVLGVPLVAWVAADWPELRDFVPAAYLLAGYRMSGLFFSRPMTDVERALLRLDRQLFRSLDLDRRIREMPRAVLEALELAYLWCYPMVPAGLVALIVAGRADLADWFWTVVLSAEFTCYGLLPWIQTRPPRAIEGEIAVDARGVRLRSLNRAVLERGSIQVNTFPSGHAAGALAVSLALLPIGSPAAAAFAVLALGIATASVVGRYHYAADSVAGLVVAIAVWVLTRWLWRP